MKKRIIGTSSGQNTSFFKDRFFVCFFAVFCAGLAVGAITAGISKSQADSVVFNVWQQNFLSVTDGNLFSVFVDNFASCLIYFIVIYSLGVCAVGTPFLFVTPFVLGIGKGVMLGFLLSRQKFLEVLRAILFFIPQNIIFCITVLFAINLAAKMSLQTFSSFAQIKIQQQYISFKKYNHRFIVYGSFLFFYCLIDSVLMKFY